jgi:hypothetical protein
MRIVLTRDGEGRVRLDSLRVGRRAFVTIVRSVKGNVDDLPMAKPVVQLNPRGSA